MNRGPWVSSSSSSSFIFKTSIFPRSARVGRSSQYEAPPHITEHCPFRVQTKHLHIILTHSYQVFLPLPTHLTQLPPPHFYRLIPNHPHMPKPPQSTRLTTSSTLCRRLYKSTLHFLSFRDTLNPQKTVQIHTELPILQRHPAHPSHHHPFHSLQTVDYLSSSRRFQSHMSMHSGHKPCISFPLCGMMHPSGPSG